MISAKPLPLTQKTEHDHSKDEVGKNGSEERSRQPTTLQERMRKKRTKNETKMEEKPINPRKKGGTAKGRNDEMSLKKRITNLKMDKG